MMKSVAIQKPERLTISLGPGQREALEKIADYNHSKLAFIVRYALDRFIEERSQKQLRLELNSKD
jgi:predicted transcriptional regulator